MNTATFIRNIEGWRGDARLYHVDPPMKDWDDKETNHVIVSAVVVPFGSGPETYIFPARADGATISMLELDGSFKGGLDHEQALRNAGYSVSAKAEPEH